MGKTIQQIFISNSTGSIYATAYLCVVWKPAASIPEWSYFPFLFIIGQGYISYIGTTCSVDSTLVLQVYISYTLLVLFGASLKS